MLCIAPIEVASKTGQSSEKYLQELPIKGFVLEAVPLSSLEHKTDEPYAGRANKGLFTLSDYAAGLQEYLASTEAKIQPLCCLYLLCESAGFNIANLILSGVARK